MKVFYIFLLGSLFAFSGKPGFANRVIDVEHVKSAMIYQLMNFIKIPSKPNIWQICLIDGNNMKEAMNQIWDKQYIVAREVYSSTFPNGFGDCHVIYYGGTNKRDAKRYINYANENSILSMGSADSFIDQSGHIGFVTHKGEVRIEVNLKSLRITGFDINSSVLQSAIRVVK